MFLSVVFTVATALQGAPPPDPQNPYCGTVPTQFVAWPELPECEDIDFECLFACLDLWQEECHNAYEWGCSAWTTSDNRYLRKRTEAEEDYMNCLTMTAPEQQYQCTMLYEADMDSLHDGLDYSRGQINQGVQDRLAAANESFCQQVANCCN